MLCLAVDCPGARIPEGECCAVCPEDPTLPPECAVSLIFQCNQNICIQHYYNTFWWNIAPCALLVPCSGDSSFMECACTYCLPQSVLCEAVKCPRPVVPEGQCCPVCPKYKGNWAICIAIHMNRNELSYDVHLCRCLYTTEYWCIVFNALYTQCVNTMDKRTCQVTPFHQLMGATHGECAHTGLCLISAG